MTHETLRDVYSDLLEVSVADALEKFPSPPEQLLSPAEFVSTLVSKAAQSDVRATHPFLKNAVQGRYGKPQLREWVRQDYVHVIASIRRHALAAAAASECELLRSLLTYVAAEADADPVGGAYFALPQLWVKFGIALGMTREEVIRAKPSRELLAWEERAMEDARQHPAVPVSLFIHAMIDPALAAIVGSALQVNARLTAETLDYFWAIAGNRWGEDAGRVLIESRCATAEDQRAVWHEYTHERESLREAERLTILQRAVESIPNL